MAKMKSFAVKVRYTIEETIYVTARRLGCWCARRTSETTDVIPWDYRLGMRLS